MVLSAAAKAARVAARAAVRAAASKATRASRKVSKKRQHIKPRTRVQMKTYVAKKAQERAFAKRGIFLKSDLGKEITGRRLKQHEKKQRIQYAKASATRARTEAAKRGISLREWNDRRRVDLRGYVYHTGLTPPKGRLQHKEIVKFVPAKSTKLRIKRPTLDQSFWIGFGGIPAAGIATQNWSKVGPFMNKVKDSLGKKKGKR